MSDEWQELDNFIVSEISENNGNIGGFAVAYEELFWNVVTRKGFPPIDDARLLNLPLHIHLARGDVLGSDFDTKLCTECVVPQMNLFWSSARISFDLVKVTEHEWPVTINGTPLVELKDKIWSLARDHKSGRMSGKDTRKDIFLNHLIGPEYLNPSTFDVWIFDLIGQQSQGCCIDRQSRTIIMGRRSTKGYEVPTLRPVSCLAKTMAHELGHALGLNHPKGRKFKDGTSCVAATGDNNLMVGGVDAAGGGGELLCPWQVLCARHHANEFLTEVNSRCECAEPSADDTNTNVHNTDTIVDITEASPRDSQAEFGLAGEHTGDSLRMPSRTVFQLDALEWLAGFCDQHLPGEVFTSVPDISELYSLFPAPHRNTQNYGLYKEWFKQVVRLILSKTPRYAIFLQTDIRALTGKSDKVMEFIDKSALIQEVAESCDFTLVWHKIVTKSEHFAQKRVSHTPTWSHLICVQRRGVPLYETRDWRTPDVFTRGDMTWERAVGLHAAMTGVSFLKHICKAETVVDPFCGLGTILAVANALDLNSVGNDLSRKRAKRAAELDLRYAICCLTYKQREHFGVVERLPYNKHTVPKPIVWSSPANTDSHDMPPSSDDYAGGSQRESATMTTIVL